MGSTWSSSTKRVIAIVRESSARDRVSRSASSMTTNWPFATSHPLTISSFETSRSCCGHQRLFLIGVRHSLWSIRNDTSDSRAAGFVASAIPTGMLTKPKLIDPFQTVLIRGRSPIVGGRTEFAEGLAFPSKVSNVEKRTIPRLWRDAISAGREGPAYLAEDSPGAWRELSWAEAGQAVDELANGLLARGIRKGDAFGILSRTRLEWTLFDFALALVGGITAPVYPNSSTREAAYVLEHSEARGVLVEDEAQGEKVAGLGLEHVLSIEELDSLRSAGVAYAREHPGALAEAEAAIGEDDLYTYIYTSGTTGPPKGCMIRHRNYYVMTSCIERIEGLSLDRDVMLLYLPLAHNFGRLMALWGAYAGFTIAFCPNPNAVRDALPQVRPTLLPSVPRVYEKAHSAVVSRLEEASGPRRHLAEWALGVGRRVSGLRQQRKAVPWPLALQHRLADRLLYSKVKQRFGGRLRFGISGGAPLAKEIAELFHALDIPILEGWGLTECTTAATVNRPRRFRFGTVGPAMPGVEVKTDDEGELLIRSATVFAGYLKDEEATRAVLTEDGWLRSGDV